MDKDPDIEKIIEYMRKEGWAGGKPGPAKDPEFELIYKRLRDGGLEKYTKLEYPYIKNDSDLSDYLVGKVSMATGVWALIEHVHLYRSNITGDYKAEIKLPKPKNFKFKCFKENVERDIPRIIYPYNAKGFVTKVREGSKYAYVNVDLLVQQTLRLANTLDFINKNPNKIDLVADLDYN